MNRLVCGVMAVTGCVVLAGASVAETAEVRGYDGSEAKEVAPRVHTSSELSSRRKKWSMESHPNPNVGKEETKDLLRAKRPK